MTMKKMGIHLALIMEISMIQFLMEVMKMLLPKLKIWISNSYRKTMLKLFKIKIKNQVKKLLEVFLLIKISKMIKVIHYKIYLINILTFNKLKNLKMDNNKRSNK